MSLFCKHEWRDGDWDIPVKKNQRKRGNKRAHCVVCNKCGRRKWRKY